MGEAKQRRDPETGIKVDFQKVHSDTTRGICPRTRNAPEPGETTALLVAFGGYVWRHVRHLREE